MKILLLVIAFILIFLRLLTIYKTKYKKWTAERSFNGKKIFSRNYKGRNLHGTATEWYESGQMRNKSHYKNGEIDGLATEWYESGKKKIEVNFIDGKPDGLATEWHESGNKKIEVNFRGGQADELATEWSDSDKEILSATLHKRTDLEHGDSFSYHYFFFRKK